MSEGSIRIRGARQNNLRGVSVDIPRDKLVAITGVSGSGKSSLAFDTLFREGERRFLQTLSAYARQFVGRMEKPDVDSIDGLSPAIAVDQKSTGRGARSTVGTLTEIFDHLRVLFARAGTAHCAQCSLPLALQTSESVVQQVLSEFGGQATLVLAPVVRDRKGHHRPLFQDLTRKGFVRARVDGEVRRIEEVGDLERYKRHTIEVVLDRLKPARDDLTRLREAIEQALDLAGGEVVIKGERAERSYSTSRTCPGCGADAPPLEPRLFSFNSPHGACPSCDGLGVQKRACEKLVVSDPELSVRAGALRVTRKSGGALLFPRVDFRYLEQIAQAHGFSLDTPWKKLDRAARKILLSGAGDERYEDQASWNGERFQGSVKWMRRFRGVLPAIEKAQRNGTKHLDRFFAVSSCTDCGGARLKPAARAVKFGGTTLPELTRLPIRGFGAALRALSLTQREERIGRELTVEIQRRVEFLDQVGLDYLTLDRSADTLSGGEAQRIRLAAQLASGLQGVLYVLDEPSIGLHARDHGRLLGALERLRDAGNTVVVVEHDEATLRAADWIVDVGPLAGRHGGEVVAQGSPEVIARGDSPTGRFLRNELRLAAPELRRKGTGRELCIVGARAFNLAGIDVTIPLGTLTVLAGVSGSGKSTLQNRILLPAVLRHLERESPPPLEHERIRGLEHIGDLVCIDSAPIGRTPRSNPATYTDASTPIRDLFANLPEARMRGWSKSRFSFNVAGGRCEACGGAGAKLVELQFLAPVTVACDACGGERFQAETLEVRFKGQSIADVLALTAEDALELFRDFPQIARPLATMCEIGLGYLTLGQPSTTLSGGEAQRIKLALHLQKPPRAPTLYLLDEPTTGLHQQDVQKLVAALQKLVDLGHTVVVIEHNLDVVRAADHVIELGPEGGERGGRLIATGTPEEIEATASSPTGIELRALHSLRRRGRARPESRVAERTGMALDTIEIGGARTHNLQDVTLSIPREKLVVITGPSGSGKSSLALDTLHAEGRRRFVQSLSTYTRQFLGSGEKPPIDRLDGLGPTVAVEAGSMRGQPRSTVATTTEIHDHLRVLFARAAAPRCPTHLVVLERTDPGAIAKRAAKALDRTQGWIVAPIFGPDVEHPQDGAAALAEALSSWKSAGFVRYLLDGDERRVDGPAPEWKAGETPRIDLVIDRLVFAAGARTRIAEAAEQAAGIAGGRVSLLAADGRRLEFSTQGACPSCGFRLEHKLEPRHFSFNTHAGACVECDGLGTRVRCSPELLIADPSLPLVEGAIGGKLGTYLTKGKGFYEFLLRTVASEHGIDLARPFERLDRSERALLLSGEGAKPLYRVEIEKSSARAEIEERFSATWPGLAGHVDAWHKKTEDADWAAILEKVMERGPCDACEGERLRPEARAALLGGLRLPELLRLSIEDALGWLDKLALAQDTAAAIASVLSELRSRLELLDKVGLAYLTLDRPTGTLSGGEARRVRLSASLGSKLVGVCYVLDEPTVGLHPADVDRLTDALLELRDGQNSVIVVEHDENVMRRADWIVDLGPGAGRHGGRVVAAGTPQEVARTGTSLTAAALRGEFALDRTRREVARDAASIGVRGARLHNLTGVDFAARFGAVTGLCGPSGSGKSTLVLECLVPALVGERNQGRWKALDTPRGGDLRTVVIDSTPIGRTPASNPATYAGVMDPLRELFARTQEARTRGFGPAHFSFNSPKGRCQACEGRGATLIEMQFLPDLWLDCEECGGKRYSPEVLEVRFRGKSIADVLALSIEEAAEFLEAQPRTKETLRTLCEVGLGYLGLGQSAITLSGGEAQRLKLASELVGQGGATPSVLILDEPSTGLHASDVIHLARVLDRLARAGHAVILIEHHTGLLSMCDELWELGPGGGAAGGRLIARGTPEELARARTSITGPFLARELERGRASRKPKARPPVARGKRKQVAS